MNSNDIKIDSLPSSIYRNTLMGGGGGSASYKDECDTDMDLWPAWQCLN